MPLIDVQARAVADGFHPIEAGAPVTPGALIPLALLSACVARGETLPRPLGVVLEPQALTDGIVALLGHVDLVAVAFPKFRDGRGFTLARALRERHGFQGEIRAIGHVIPDQLQALRDCGVSTIETAPLHPPAQWAAARAQESDSAPRQLLNRMLTRANG